MVLAMENPSERPGPPPILSPDGRWLWDGSQWVQNSSVPRPPFASQTRPSTDPVSPHTWPASQAQFPGAPQRTSDQFVWLMVAVPVLYVLLEVYLPRWFAEAEMDLVPFVVSVIAYSVLAALDSRELEKVGLAPPGWSWFLAPVYLIQRVKRTGSSWLIPGAWAVAFVGSVAYPMFWASTPQWDVDAMESDIETWFAEKGATDITVTCPRDIRYDEGDIAICTAARSGVTTSVTVTNLNDGYYEWDVDDWVFPVVDSVTLENNVEKGLKQKGHRQVDARCKYESSTSPGADLFVCTIETSDGPSTIEMNVFSDQFGDWEVVNAY